ncbi:MAG: EndoU domain-containing protein [Ruminococcus sp.]|nr:EndoU domain-containing protein [Ruminococcus sp.]
MKLIKRILSAALAVAVIALAAGCSGAKLKVSQINGSSYDITSSVQSSQSSAQSSKSDRQTYTMADIKKLKNTEHFAKNTLEHIFDGTINSKGKATGYHYSMVTDSKGKIIDGTRSKTDEHGVFTGKVEVSGVKKNGFSSFYPESWTPQQVVDAINTAYDDALKNPDNPQGELWIGYSGNLEIDMYMNKSKQITTAYPVYEGD